jgi:hypothetical protein
MNQENTNEPLSKIAVSGSFYREIMDSKERTFYAKLIKQYSNHDIGRVYYIGKQHDGALYSGDRRGTGQGGYVSNVIDSYFEKSSEAEYSSQN